ncbi:MAG: molybdate ABC transporter substrate-binding protein, partial [Chloroflexaceae bacterium]|nr:molybdate ABC transporter substrate-binding protein [Chloroflexaceae bacterium]
ADRRRRPAGRFTPPIPPRPTCRPPHPRPTEPAPRVLRVFAAASLTSAFEVLGAAFGTQHPGVEIIFSFAGSHHLAQQLANGPPADVFAAAHRTSMDAAIQMGRVQTGSERICAYNRLAVVTGRTNSLPFHSLGDLAQPGRRLVFGSDATAVGHYALDLLEQVDHAGAFGARGRLAVLQNVVGYAATPRAVLERIMQARPMRVLFLYPITTAPPIRSAHR